MCHLCWFLNYLWFNPQCSVVLLSFWLHLLSRPAIQAMQPPWLEKYFQLSWKWHWQDQAHSPLPSKNLSPIGKFFYWSNTECRNVWSPNVNGTLCNILHMTCSSAMLVRQTENPHSILLNQCNHGCTKNYNLSFIAIYICWTRYC